MSSLYSVGYLTHALVPFAFDDDLLTQLEPAGQLAPALGEEPRGTLADAASLVDRARAFTPTVVREVIRGLAPTASAEEILAAMSTAESDVWSLLVAGAGEIGDTALYAAHDGLMLQDLMSRAQPERYRPVTLACIELDLDAIHPDVRRISFDVHMAARVLLDHSLDHPLHRRLGGSTQFEAVILAATSLRREHMDESDRPALECKIWIPAALVGDLPRHPIWESAAYGRS